MVPKIVLLLFSISKLASGSSRILLQGTASNPLIVEQIATIPEPTTTSTIAPLHPPQGYILGAFGQVCPQVATSAGYQCESITDIASDSGGRLLCDRDSECCMCSSIQCGFGSTKCREVRFGYQSAYGVGEIEIAGHVHGAIVHCNGIRSCQSATITGNNIIAVDCDGDRSCQFATIIIQNPTEQFVLDCGGVDSCDGLRIELIFTGAPPGFECRHVADPTVPKNVFEIAGFDCGNIEACNMAEITINNELGCDTVNVQRVGCTHYNSCKGAVFNLIGDVKLERCHCHLSPNCLDITGLDTCSISSSVV